MNLRQEAIEAMARASWAYLGEDETWGVKHGYYANTQQEYRDEAAQVLDALLDFLTEHADEWEDSIGQPFVPAATEYGRAAELLVAVLRDTE